MSAPLPRILCVDDEPQNLKLLEAILVPRGYAVLTAANGREALQTMTEQGVDLVLLDVMMPELDGFEVCRRIKDDARWRQVPVIMITALSSKEDRIRGIEAGSEDFISKPFDQSEVLARIRMLLKLKTLNDGLSRAYTKLTTLTSLGRALIERCDPLHFDLLSDIDHIVGRLLRRTDTAAEGPETIVVGYCSEAHWVWRRYANGPTGIVSHPLALDLAATRPQPCNATVVFANAADLASSALRPLVATLRAWHQPVTNGVGFLGDDFCFAAFNYGRDLTEHDAAVLECLVTQSLFLKSISARIKETDQAFDYLVQTLARAAEVNDADTGNHIVRVGEYCTLLAHRLGMPEPFVASVRIQAQMHDIGKVHIPATILNKAGPLTPEEFEEMKRHTLYGARILGDHPRLAMARAICLGHHERWDGSGYPHGLAGERIPFAARLLNIADQYDALRNQRVYKPPFDHETACRIITEGDGRTLPGHFDPRILRAFRELAASFDAVHERLKG